MASKNPIKASTQKQVPNKTQDILEHDYQETLKAQDRERQQNRHSFDSRADEDEYSRKTNRTEYSERDNQSRFTSENDYPDGNTERYDTRRNEREFGRENPLNSNGRAYDRAEDYEREREDVDPFLNESAGEFYGNGQMRDSEADETGRFASHNSDSYFGGTMGYYTKHDADEKINKSVQKGRKP